MRSKSNQQGRRNWRYYFIAALPIITVFFIVPFELYYNSKEYWNFNYKIPLTFAVFGVLLYMPLSAMIGVIFRIRRRISEYICISLFAFGLFILFSDIFSPLQTNLLDGSKLVSSEPLKGTFIESAFFLILIISVWKMSSRRIVLIAVPFTILMVILSGIYSLLIGFSGKPGSTFVEGKPDPNLRGNIYHILLDAMQTDAAKLFLQESNNAKYFTGFILFQNNISNYLYTFASLNSYLTGTIYEKGEFVKWKEMYKKSGLLASLDGKGYKIMMYSHHAGCKNPFVSDFVTLDDIYEQKTKIEDPQYTDFVQIWIARIMPNILTNEALSIGVKIGKYVYGFISRPEDLQDKIPMTISEGKEPFSSVLMLKELIETEKDRTPNGNYIYAHAVLPHSPFIFDENCNYNPTSKERSYYVNVRCALTLVIDFIEELKRLGRYDDSTILIHGDHGGEGRGFISKNDSKIVETTGEKKGNLDGAYLKNKLGWTEDQLKARVMTLLMIKPPNSSGELIYSRLKSQLIDIYPTIVDLLGLPSQQDSIMSGYSLFKDSFPETREAAFFLFPPGDEIGPRIRKIVISNQEMLEKSQLIDEGFLENFEVMDLPKEGLVFKIGANEGRLILDGFSVKETSNDKSNSWRWALNKKSKMTFDSLRLPKSSKILVRFKVNPFFTNRNKEMIVKSKISEAKVRLKPEWSWYSVVLEFPSGEDPSLEIFYEDARSPESMGFQGDQRNLSVAWSEISLHYTSSVTDR